MTVSLYQRLGSAAGLAAIADDAVDRHAANPLLAPRWRGKDLPQLKALSEVFLAACAGGPPPRDACGIGTPYAGMHFSEGEWSAVRDDIDATLVERGVDATERRELARALHAAPGTFQEQALRRLNVSGSGTGSAHPSRRPTT
ncbi:MAG: hypothetical protein Q8N44_01705 [Rubrivivax sp.]|nr:hypothetical protein [Rubrivivax sp.]MDP3082393.1 hypothetical protein [Rubrivivax sp.]